MPLTPRIELKLNGVFYINISDLNAVIEVKDEQGQITVSTQSKLVDKDQQSPPTGDINCKVSYCFKDEMVTLKFSYDNKVHADAVKIIFPVIAKASAKINAIANNGFQVINESSLIKISSNHPIEQLPSTNGRVFNFVPGFEAIPFCITQNDAVINVKVM